jgi:hypothetical protein
MRPIVNLFLVGKTPSDAFPVQDGLKQRDALSLLLFNFALEYSMKKGLEFNETQELLVCTDVNIRGPPQKKKKKRLAL